VKKFEKIICIVLISLMLFFLHPFIFGDRARADNRVMEELAIVRFEEKIKAQNFILTSLEGNEVSLEDYRGKIVLLNFWATWCPPCRAEMPSMEKLYKKFKDKDFTILAIDVQEDANSVKIFREKYKLNFPILLDSDGSVQQFYGVISLPTTYLVDREGNIIGGAIGARDWANESAFLLINQLLIASPDF
jgi:thiol-disulfide isomerase/thioredoxin